MNILSDLTKLLFALPTQSWYNDSADAESKAADAALPRWREDYTGNPWLENQMSALQPLDFLRSWYDVRKGRSQVGEHTTARYMWKHSTKKVIR